MRATLEPRKSVRLNWFKQEQVPFSVQRELRDAAPRIIRLRGSRQGAECRLAADRHLGWLLLRRPQRPRAGGRMQIQPVALMGAVDILDDLAGLAHGTRADREAEAGDRRQAHRQRGEAANKQISCEIAHHHLSAEFAATGVRRERRISRSMI